MFKMKLVVSSIQVITDTLEQYNIKYFRRYTCHSNRPIIVRTSDITFLSLITGVITVSMSLLGIYQCMAQVLKHIGSKSQIILSAYLKCSADKLSYPEAFPLFNYL